MSCTDQSQFRIFKLADGTTATRITPGMARVVGWFDAPCGKCGDCRGKSSMHWQTRLMQEALMHRASVALCLTYKPEALPPDGSLCERDMTLFLKRLRARVAARGGAAVRYWYCGEYSPRLLRPHYHAALFGYDGGADAKPWSKSEGGQQYTSPELTELWPHGQVTFQEWSDGAAAYLAGHVSQKAALTPKPRVEWCDADGVVHRRAAEFHRMSTSPGLAASFYAKYGAQLRAHDFTVVKGQQRSLPRYYDKLHARVDPVGLAERKAQRVEAGASRAWDQTPARKAVRAQVTQARILSRKRDGLD